MCANHVRAENLKSARSAELQHRGKSLFADSSQKKFPRLRDDNFDPSPAPPKQQCRSAAVLLVVADFEVVIEEEEELREVEVN
jgi:hypothetical protein